MREEVTEGPCLVQIVFEVLRETRLEHITELLDIDTGGGHDLGEVLVDQGLWGALDPHL